MYKSPPSASQKEAIESDSIDPDIKNQTETDIMNEDMTTKNEVTKEIIQESDSENPNPKEKQETSSYPQLVLPRSQLVPETPMPEKCQGWGGGGVHVHVCVVFLIKQRSVHSQASLMSFQIR